MIDDSHWRCFLFLENELFDIQYHIEFTEKNKDTFSIKLRSIILQACAEIEKMCKLICGIELAAHANMETYAEHFNKNYPEFSTITIETDLYLKNIQPWSEWSKQTTFWEAYNAIKHSGKFEQATLENAIKSLAGLFALLLLWIAKENNHSFPLNDFSPSQCFYFTGTRIKLLSCEHASLNILGFPDPRQASIQ